MRKISLVLLLSVTLLQQACKKDHDNPNPGPGNPPVKRELLRRIEWDNNTKAVFEYNPDSSLKQINYSLNNTVSSTEFKWQNGKLLEMHDSRSIYKNVFDYDADKVSKMTNKQKQVVSPDNYYFAYEYNADGTVHTLKYYTLTGAGMQLKTTSNYHYDANGNMLKVVSLWEDGYRVTHVIDGYTSPVNFEPVSFIDFPLIENYPVYNYPVLSKMKGLPKTVTRLVKMGNDPEIVDIIDRNVFDITGTRINKQTISREVPGVPPYRIQEGVYYY